MFRTIRNYLPVISLLLVISTTSLLAAPVTLEGAKTKTIRVDSTKEHNYYSEVLSNGGTDSYSLNVGVNKEAKVVVRSDKAISLKVQGPDGSVQNYSPAKYFSLELNSEGEYMVDLGAISVSLYTFEVTQ